MNAAAASFSSSLPPAPRSHGDTIQLLVIKAPKVAAALKVIAEMALAEVLAKEQSTH